MKLAPKESLLFSNLQRKQNLQVLLSRTFMFIQYYIILRHTFNIHEVSLTVEPMAIAYLIGITEAIILYNIML